MKRFVLTVTIETDSDVNENDFEISNDDVLDGYTIFRSGDDNTEVFKFQNAYISKIDET